MPQKGFGPGGVPLLPHGSWGAYQRHRKAGEAPCPLCAAANRARSRARYAARGGKPLRRAGRPLAPPSPISSDPPVS